MAKECKNCAHESNFKKHECGTCMVSYFDGEQLGLPSNFKQKPMTNADRIRAMSDEELADFLADDYRACPPKPRYHKCSKYIDKCDGCWLEWLKQPAKGE